MSTTEKLVDKILSDVESSNRVRIRNENGVRIFNIDFGENSNSIYISRGGDACTKQEYEHALNGEIKTYRDFYHAHDCFFIVYVEKGENLEIIEDVPYPMTQNDLIILTPFTRHHNYHTDESRVLFIHVKEDQLIKILLPAIMENALFSQFFSDFIADRYIRKALLFENCREFAEPIIKSILSEYVEKSPLTNTMILYLLGILIITLARLNTYREKNYASQSSERMDQILSYITEHYQDITLTDAAEKFGYNPAYLSRRIREYSGRTFKQLLTDYRLNMSLLMLSEGQKTVDEIAWDCGYQDLSTFYKAFKARYHCAPKEMLTKLQG